MEFFILAAVSRGDLKALYNLQHLGGLQPGGIHPALRRLEAERLLERTQQQRRRRRTISVTPEGEQLLREHWKDCLQEHPDVESILRSTAVALLMDDFPTADGYLISMARTSEGRAERAAISDGQDRGRSPMQRFGLMRRLWDTRRHQSAAALFREIVTELEEQERS